jgi:hypothetical protein
LLLSFGTCNCGSDHYRELGTNRSTRREQPAQHRCDNQCTGNGSGSRLTELLTRKNLKSKSSGDLGISDRSSGYVRLSSNINYPRLHDVQRVLCQAFTFVVVVVTTTVGRQQAFQKFARFLPAAFFFSLLLATSIKII